MTTMTTRPSHPAPLAPARPHAPRPAPRDDSPFAPYLRRWLARWAAQHRELLRNIAAVPALAS